MKLAELLAGIDLCNNGYIFAPTAAEIATARANPQAVKIIGGVIYPIDRPINPYPRELLVPRAYTPNDGDFDYEGAILARQENAGFYD